MVGYQVKQSSTAYPLIFLMVDSSDHISAKTGLSPTVVISKAGGSFASPAGAVSEVGNGWYKVAGNATDTATLGPIALHATATGADPTDALYPVVAYDPQSATSLGLSNLDAAVSSRSTYAGGDTAGTTTLLSRLTSTRAGLLDNLDAAISTRSTYAGGDTAGTTTLLSRLTATRAGLLDNLDAAISTRSTYAGADTSGTTTLLARLTSTRATNLDNLDAAVSTRSTFDAATDGVTVGDKTGYSLASGGLDAVSMAAPSGVPATFREMMVMVYRRFFRKVVKDAATGTVKAYADDGLTALTTQLYTDDGAGNETLGAAD